MRLNHLCLCFRKFHVEFFRKEVAASPNFAVPRWQKCLDVVVNIWRFGTSGPPGEKCRVLSSSKAERWKLHIPIILCASLAYTELAAERKWRRTGWQSLWSCRHSSELLPCGGIFVSPFQEMRKKRWRTDRKQKVKHTYNPFFAHIKIS